MYYLPNRRKHVWIRRRRFYQNIKGFVIQFLSLIVGFFVPNLSRIFGVPNRRRRGV